MNIGRKCKNTSIIDVFKFNILSIKAYARGLFAEYFYLHIANLSTTLNFGYGIFDNIVTVIGSSAIISLSLTNRKVKALIPTVFKSYIGSTKGSVTVVIGKAIIFIEGKCVVSTGIYIYNIYK